MSTTEPRERREEHTTMIQLNDVAEKSAAIHDAMNATIARIRGNRDLSDDGRNRQLAKAFTNAQDDLARLREQYETERAAATKKLTREIFGAQSVAGADAISLRDAADRASQLTDPDDALRLIQQANNTGDEVLARAIAQVAYSNRAGFLGQVWAPVLQAFLDERPSVATRLKQLESAAGGGVGAEFQAEGHFFLARPSELDRMTSSAIASYAAASEPTPKPSVYQEMRQQLGYSRP